ncbi:MAG: T9SS type A sorting domain-containing protein, partial [Bacteroidia bacterium]
SICTSIVNNNFSKLDLINVYPNPSNGLFKLELNTTSDIIVINALGAVILNQTMNSGTQNLDLQQFATGIYVIKVVQGNKQQTIKLVKE